jgi:hypothetical protein
VLRAKWGYIMDYKKLIIEMLEKADTVQLEKLFHFIMAFLGLGK